MMAIQIQIQIPHDRLSEFCQRWKIAELSLFGSVLRQDFRTDSDVDVLVLFEPGARHSLFSLVRMEDELADLFNRKVDLVTREAIETSRNHLRRELILDSAEVVYAA